MTSLRAHPGTRAVLASLAFLALTGCPAASTPFDAATDTLADARSCAPAVPSHVAGCRADGDCSRDRFEQCVAPGEVTRCGVCIAPMRFCETDTDCPLIDGAAQVCERYFAQCTACNEGRDGWENRQCIPSCTTAGCADGMACGADGHCAPIRCDAGYACPLGTTCQDAGGDEHGCVRAGCATDTDCPCGTGCVEGRCYDTLGGCELPAA